MYWDTWDTILLVLAVVALWVLLVYEAVGLFKDIDKGGDKYDH